MLSRCCNGVKVLESFCHSGNLLSPDNSQIIGSTANHFALRESYVHDVIITREARNYKLK